MVLGVGGVGKGVADDVEGDGDHGQHGHGKVELVAQRGDGHQLTAGINEVAQRGGIQRETDANIGDEHLVANGRGDGQGHAHGDDADQIGQQVLDDDPPGGGAQTAGGQVVIPVPDDDDLVADKPGHAQPARETQGKDDGVHAGVEDVGDKDEQQGLGDVVKDVVELGEEKVQLPHIAPQHPHEDAQHRLYTGHGEANEQGGAGARPDAGPDVLADVVGAEEEALLAGSQVGQGAAGLVVVDGDGIVLVGQIGLEEGEGQRGHHDQQEKDSHLVLEEGPHGGPPVGVVGVAAPLCGGGVEAGKGEQLLIGHIGSGHLLLELLLQGSAQLFRLVVAIGFHQREPSFRAKLMRGSNTAMRISPKSRPRIEMTA